MDFIPGARMARRRRATPQNLIIRVSRHYQNLARHLEDLPGERRPPFNFLASASSEDLRKEFRRQTVARPD